MKEIRTEVLINAPVQKVWGVLIDFKNYPQWNPFIKSISGNLGEGETIQAELKLVDKKPMQIRPQIISVRENKELRWLGRILIVGIFDAEHIFELIENENHTTLLIHREKFSGVLVPFLRRLIDIDTRRSFEMMNENLKKRCEVEI